MDTVSFRRQAAAWSLVAGGILVGIAYFVDPDMSADGVDLARAYAEEPERIQVSAVALRLAFALVLVPVFVLAGEVRGRGGGLATLAAALALLGAGLSGLLVVDLYDLAIYDQHGGEGWQAVSARLEALPGMHLLFLTAYLPHLLALPVAMVAAWRAGIAPGWGIALAAAAPLATLAAPAWGLLVMAGLHVVLGVVLWRILRAPGPRATPPPRVA